MKRERLLYRTTECIAKGRTIKYIPKQANDIRTITSYLRCNTPKESETTIEVTRKINGKEHIVKIMCFTNKNPWGKTKTIINFDLDAKRLAKVMQLTIFEKLY